MASLELLIEEILRKLTENSEELNSMNFERLTRSVRSLTNTIQNFIKIIETKAEYSDAQVYENSFIEKIISDEESFRLANDLLERLQNI